MAVGEIENGKCEMRWRKKKEDKRCWKENKKDKREENSIKRKRNELSKTKS